MKSMRLIILLLAISTLVACGKRVEVPPAHVGKVLTRNGYAPATIPPSKFRLPACMAYCDKLIVMEVSDNALGESLQIFMPRDKLNLKVDIRGTFSIPSDETIIDAIYNRVPAEDGVISAAKIYTTYGRQAIRGVMRSEITKYSISDVLAQREAIGQNIHAAVAKKLKTTSTPINISRLELADIQPPTVIVEAQESAKKREIDIQREEANAQIELVRAERALEVAKKNRLVEREKAEAIAEQNRIAAESITPQLLAYRRLEVAERIYTALAGSQNTIVVPADSSSFSDLTGDAVLAKLLGKELRK